MGYIRAVFWTTKMEVVSTRLYPSIPYSLAFHRINISWAEHLIGVGCRMLFVPVTTRVTRNSSLWYELRRKYLPSRNTHVTVIDHTGILHRHDLYYSPPNTDSYPCSVTWYSAEWTIPALFTKNTFRSCFWNRHGSGLETKNWSAPLDTIAPTEILSL